MHLRKLFTRNHRAAALAALAATIIPATAHAYVGPGAGLTAIGTVIALLAALILAVVGFVWYPVKRLMAKRRADGSPSTAATQDGIE